MPRPRLLTVAFAVVAALGGLSACSRSSTKSAPEPSEHSLAGMAAQRIGVLPAYAVDVKGNVGPIDKPSDILAQLNADIVAALEEHGLRQRWSFPPELEETARRNSTYATDPRLFDQSPLRAPNLATSDRLAEPLASQVRTMVALQPDMRYVLAPVVLRLEPAPGGMRGALRLVLLDARGSNVSWIGEFTSDVSPAYGPVITASIASRLAAAIVP